METSVKNKCKAFTSLEQSKKLAEILPLESADGGWYGTNNPLAANTTFWLHTKYTEKAALPAWSLAALLGVMICPNLEEYIKGKWDLTTFIDESLKTPIEVQDCESAVDACYELIIKLHEQKLL